MTNPDSPLRLLATDSVDAPAIVNGKMPEPHVHVQRQASHHLSDLGNAKRFVRDHGVDIRYVQEVHKWYIYRRGRWLPVHNNEVVALAKMTITNMHGEAKREQDVKLHEHALRSESRSKISAMIALAQSEPGIGIQVASLDKDHLLLNCINGTVNLLTGQLLPHDRADLCTKQVPVAFDPAATCPKWEGFLNRIMDGDAGMIRLLQQIVGMSLTGDVSEQKLFIFVGSGSNGKSTFLNTILNMLGNYAMQADPELLMNKRTGSVPTGQADLVGARLAICSESNKDRAFDEAIVKRLTGGDRMKARRIGKDFFEFDPTHKLILVTNNNPIVNGTDYGIWRRLVLVPFTQHIAESECDRQLMEKLEAEWPGILAWAVRGCVDWKQNRLVIPALVEEASRNYRREMDTMGQFIEEICDLHGKVGALILYEEYKRWCEARGETKLSQRKVGQSIKEREFESRRSGSGGQNEYHGICIRSDREAEAE